MSVHALITSELAVAIGRIGAAHPEAGVQIDYRDSDPENVWHVTAVDVLDAITNDIVYTVDDETGEVVPPLPAPNVQTYPGFDALGITVVCALYENGVPYVGIYTDDYETTLPDGRPVMAVVLNAGELYEVRLCGKCGGAIEDDNETRHEDAPECFPCQGAPTL